MSFTAYFGVASAVDRAVMDNTRDDARASTGWIRFVLKHSSQRRADWQSWQRRLSLIVPGLKLTLADVNGRRPSL
jgi:hypothetical protein